MSDSNVVMVLIQQIDRAERLRRGPADPAVVRRIGKTIPECGI